MTRPSRNNKNRIRSEQGQSIPKQREELFKEICRHGLLNQLLKAKAEEEYIAHYALDQSITKLTSDNAANFLAQELKIKSQEQLRAWCKSHGLTSSDDLLKYAKHIEKKKSVISDLISGSEEALFLRYKDRLDRVLYSLIRVESEDLAQALYYAIEAGDVEFGDAAAKHSIGPEAKTQGIVGPVDLTTPHPEIAARLRTGQARQLFEPFQAEQWHAIVRLEYRFDSELNDQTKAFLGSLLLSAKTKDIQKTLHSTYLEGS